MKFIWQYVKKHRKLLFLALVLAIINQVFSLLDPQIFRLIVDNYATKANTMPREAFIQGVILLLLAAMGVALVSRIAKNFQDYYVNVITQKVGTEMYSNSVEHTLSLPYGIFEDQRSGEVLQKLQKARQDTQTLITGLINIGFFSIIGILFVVVYAFTVHWSIGVAYFMLIPILGFFAFILSRKIKQAQKNIVAQTSALAGSTTETIRNVELVKSLGLETQEIKRLNETNDKILQLELTKVKQIRKISFIQGTIINTMRSLLLLLMLWLIFSEIITIGQFFSLLIYSFFIFGPLGQFGELATQYQEARASVEKLEEILKVKPAPKPKNAKRIEHVKDIKLSKVNFKYTSSKKDVIENLSIHINKGETVAFVGPSGSGKSTIVKLVVGLYKPTNGKILFNGTDSKTIDYDDLRRKIGLVSQETQLFAGTIRENLLFVNPKATDKECLEALKLSSSLAIIEKGGKGLDSRIGEGGIKISGGERQRLAIARALLRNPEILLFDEATSSLDSITEKEITKTIKGIKKYRPNMIIILVAHRLSTIAHSDRIYVLQKGKLAEEGTHSKLLAKKGLYYAFWQEQISAE